ncbi:Rne/Rng family ribonuclease [Aureimonas mangrovi]|uniref:Rne/Rng family ribonuclease n=1 Tax=Aureimonas mangrovi TaxID=2758041 RepID=UPI00163D776E|nr:ribonuclease E/G [Aureimonas mangrovi]
MANKMLVDASHPEETRVVVVKGNRIEEFDFESEHKKQLKGNIYLAKVTRVEPSLQAAFVEYGGNRHGFLAFGEIHPDYYQIPMADRQALIEEELARVAEEEEHEDGKAAAKPARGRTRRKSAKAAASEESESVSEVVEDADRDAVAGEEVSADAPTSEADPADGEDADAPESNEAASEGPKGRTRSRSRRRGRRSEEPAEEAAAEADGDSEAEEVDDLGSEDAMEEVPVRNRTPRKQYKIQEVIKRRQILLVQVVKEERGNKGAALTTYLSLAGRYSVLMPNTARGGGISRKITNAADRKRLKEVARDLEVPKGMGIILRTAGANRTRAEVKRDYEYLMRLWEMVRQLTLSSTAPALVYEEGSLIKRSIRDLYNKDIDQILVSGEAGYREAKDFMRMLMPSQAKVVQPYRDATPIFARQGIEGQLDKMLQPNVTLKSGGYIIINQTEALVAIDVNSGRSTREHSIEDTAYQTNLEAAEEVARQLRLRDLAGLIVIDFIDMDEKRNNRAVEKKLKDCLKNDRARIQVGRISHFGLMEMSRQRIRASVLESTMQPCPVCAGNGYIRSESSLALHVLRSIEEHLQKHGTHDIIVKVPPQTALYVLNEKRSTITDLERHYGLHIMLQASETKDGHQHISIENGAEAARKPRPEPVQPLAAVDVEIEEVEDVAEPEMEAADTESPEAGSGEEGGRNKRRRRRGRGRGRRGDDEGNGAEASTDTDEDDAEVIADETAQADGDGDEEGRERKRRRRGRRGGRRNRDGDNDIPVMDAAGGAGSRSEPIDGSDEDDGEAAERSPEPEFVPAVAVLSGEVGDDSDLDGEAAEMDQAATPPDENEVEAASAEAGASRDDNAPLDEVFPMTDETIEASDKIVESEIEAAVDQPEPVTRGPRLIANGTPADEEELAAKPKKSGWWSRMRSGS